MVWANSVRIYKWYFNIIFSRNSHKWTYLKSETKSQMQITILSTKAGRGGRINWETGTDIYMLLHIKQITNKNLLLLAGGEGDNRGWDGWMASPTQWTRVWVSSGSWWWTGKPGVLQSMGCKESDTTESLNWSCFWFLRVSSLCLMAQGTLLNTQ